MQIFFAICFIEIFEVNEVGIQFLSFSYAFGDNVKNPFKVSALSFVVNPHYLIWQGQENTNENAGGEPEAEVRVVDIPSPSSAEIDANASNHLPQVDVISKCTHCFSKFYHCKS